ncbi:hypothetical protein RB213_002106 [Colletotrichum asianum]
MLCRYKLAFHTYNYKANIKIKVSEELYNLLQERYYAIDDTILYMLAVYINSNRTTKANRLETCYLLANRNILMREFASTYNYTFYL